MKNSTLYSCYFRAKLEAQRTVSAAQPVRLGGDLFRVDAKAEGQNGFALTIFDYVLTAEFSLPYAILNSFLGRYLLLLGLGKLSD